MLAAASSAVAAPIAASRSSGVNTTQCISGRNTTRSNATFSGRTGQNAEVAGFHAAAPLSARGSGALSRGRSAVKTEVVRAVRSSSPSRRGEKTQLKTGKDGRGKTVAPNAVSPPDAEVAPDASIDFEDFDELSAKVAQLQAALAEVDNVGVMDPENLARLEGEYLRNSYDSGDEAATSSSSSSSSSSTRTGRGKKKRGAGDKKRKMTAAPKSNRSSVAAEAAGGVAGESSSTAAATGGRAKPRTRPKGGARGARVTAGASGGGAAGAKPARRTTGVAPRRRAKHRGASKQTDSMKTYLKDIGSVSLLTGAEEVELAKRIQDLMYLDGVRETLADELGQEPTKFEWACAANVSESELEARLEEGKRAKNQMIQANLRLVVSIAKRYANKSMSFQDLIQEGCVGLIRGAEKFDFKRGYKFSTYAHWWIRQAVTRSISDQSRTIRLPVHLFEIISRMAKVERQMVMKHGRDPTMEELAEALDMTVEKINQIKKASLVPVSLNQTVNEDDKRTVEETLIDDYTEHPDDATGKVLLKEDLENVLNTLNPRERDVLRLRYGLDDGRVKTLEEIGNVFSVTRERIRQIEAKALRKLRQPSRNGILREYLPSDHETQIDVV